MQLEYYQKKHSVARRLCWEPKRHVKGMKRREGTTISLADLDRDGTLWDLWTLPMLPKPSSPMPCEDFKVRYQGFVFEHTF
jgi:hypothetical protein